MGEERSIAASCFTYIVIVIVIVIIVIMIIVLVVRTGVTITCLEFSVCLAPPLGRSGLELLI